jgi:hypothetical protein
LSDNTTLSVGSGGDTIRDKDRGGIKTPIVGIDMGIGSGTEKLMTTGQASMANSMPVAVASDQSAIPVSQSGTWTDATNADTTIGGTTAPSKGLLVIGKTADGTPQYQPLPLRAGGAGVMVTPTGTVAVDGSGVTQPVRLTPAASGGLSASRIKAAASTNATSVKNSGGQVYGWYLYNNTSSAKFFKLYNKASAPSVGSDTPFFTVSIPANGGTNIEFSMGVPLGTGIAYAITTGIADSDTGAVSADDVHGVLLYN